MATRNKKAGTAPLEAEPATPAPVPEPAPSGKVLAGLTPGTLTPQGYYVPRGAVQTVDCPLFPGLDLKVDYLTSVAWRIVREDYTGAGETPVEQECRKLCGFIMGFHNWAFLDPITGEPIPCPDPNNWETFRPIVWVYGPLVELYRWLVVTGLNMALNQAMGN